MPEDMIMSPNYRLLATGGLALLNHAYFRANEPTRPLRVLAALVAQPALILLPYNYAAAFKLDPFLILQTYLTFFIALTLSIITYRISPVHPLAHVPGPRLLGVTKLWTAYIAYTGQQHKWLKSLHDEYGPIVRVGPNEVSIVDIASIKDVLGQGGLPKSAFYTSRVSADRTGSMLLVNGDDHARRRRRWTRGFAPQALKDYQDILLTRTHQLVDCFSTRLDKPVRFSTWMNYFAFDFMGDMAFGGGIELMEADGKDDDGFWELLENFARANSALVQIPWLYQTFVSYPRLARHHVGMVRYGAQKAMRRLKTPPKRKDLWYHLMDEDNLEPSNAKPSFKELVAEGMLTVIAGSDTTSAAMCSLFYCLLMDRPCYERLQREVDEVLSTAECAGSVSAAEMPYMAACINETLRLYPPVPSNGTRVVGPEGKILVDMFVPEGTAVYTPPYAVHRNPAYFSPSPDRFMPERWLQQDSSDECTPSFSIPIKCPTPVPSSSTSRSKSLSAPDHLLDRPTSESPSANILDTTAFMPFSVGPQNCVGKQLAIQEMFTLTGSLMRTFDVAFADGFDYQGWEGGVKDFFVTTRPPLDVVFTLRRNLKL